MTETQLNHLVGRSYILGFSPQKVRSLVAADFTVSCRCALIFLDLESISLDVIGGTERVIAIDVDVRLIVFPINVLSRSPRVSRFVERVFYVVSAIPSVEQCTCRRIIIIDDVDAHSIPVAETRVVHTCCVDLFNISRKCNFTRSAPIGVDS